MLQRYLSIYNVEHQRRIKRFNQDWTAGSKKFFNRDSVHSREKTSSIVVKIS